MILALCFPESGLNKNVVHLGKFDKKTKGICGVKSYWIDIIPELTKENINTLRAGELVLDYLLVENKDNLFEALKDYKGAEKNLAPVYKTLEIYKEIR